MNSIATKILASTMFGAISGIANLAYGIALAALLFSGSLIPGYELGVGVILLGGVILGLVVTLRSGQPNAVAEVQETTIAILVTTVVVATTNMSGSVEEAKVLTTLAICGTFSIATGLLFLIAGKLRIGGFANFLPFPVIAGFIAGSGWLLLIGGISMVAGEHHELTSTLFSLTNALIFVKVIPAIVFALLMMVMLRRLSHPMVAPLLLVTAGGGFYLVLLIAGIDVEKARSFGWLLEITSSHGIMFPTLDMLRLIDWQQVIIAIPMAISAAALSMIAMLLNTNALELETGNELDANAELRITGIANILVGFIGGLSGFIALGHSLLAKKMGVHGRSAGFANVTVLIIGMLIAEPLISKVPIFLMAGLVMFLGLGLLYEWLIKTHHKLPLTEWMIVVIIFIVIATLGLFEGLAVGLLVSVIMFIHSYSKLPVIRLNASGCELRSSVDRSAIATRILDYYGSSIQVIYLQGYLFFGTADHIVDGIRKRISRRDMPVLRFLILDFSHVGGCDSAATLCFIKIRNIAKLGHVKVIFTRVSVEVEYLLQQAGLDFDVNELLSLAIDSDHALEICESTLLTEQYDELNSFNILHYLETILGSHSKLPELVEAMEYIYLKAGNSLIHRDDDDTSVFILVQGQLKVQIDLPDGRQLRLRTMTSGAVVGEISFYLHKKRTADVIVEEDSIVLRLDAQVLAHLEKENSEVAILIHRLLAINLSEKLMSANRLIEIGNICFYFAIISMVTSPNGLHFQV